MELTEKTIDDFINSGKDTEPQPTLIVSSEVAKKLREAGLIPEAEPSECNWSRLAKDLGVEEG